MSTPKSAAPTHQFVGSPWLLALVVALLGALSIWGLAQFADAWLHQSLYR